LLLAVKEVPVVVFKPNVVLYLFGAIQSQAAMRLALNQFVNKVGCFPAPPVGDVLLLYLDLLAQYVIADLLPVLALIRPFPEHALVCNHAHRKIIYRHAVVLPTHHLGRHVTRRA
jgi:hypothetical protein